MVSRRVRVVDLYRALCDVRSRPGSRLVHSSSQLWEKKDFDYERKLPVWDYGSPLSEHKRLYVFGSSRQGALGLSNLVKHVGGKKVKLSMRRPCRHLIGHLDTVTDIAAGHGFSLVAIKPRGGKGPSLLGGGRNEYSQLGYQEIRREEPMAMLISFWPIALPFAGKDGKVLAIGAGRNHSLVSVQGQGVIAFGDNSNGQCGRRVISDEEYFGSRIMNRIQCFANDDVISISTKYDISLCLTKSGLLYSFGDNSKGQLGRGQNAYPGHIPDVVQGDLKGQKVVKVTTSGSSVLAVTESHELFGWGCNEWGQVDPETPGKIIYEPKAIPLRRWAKKVKDVALGDLCSFILTESGEVYVWGAGQSLGMGPSSTRIRYPVRMPPALFGRNEFSMECLVTRITAGHNHAAAVNSNGDMFTWGLNVDGCLGYGFSMGQPQWFPFKVCFGGTVTNASLGVNHTLALCKGGF